MIYQRYKSKYNIIIEQNNTYTSSFKHLYLYSGMEIRLCFTNQKYDSCGYYNGEIVTFTGNIEMDKLKCINSNQQVIYVEKIKEVNKSNSEEYYPISPLFLTTIHKAQGYTINNVIVDIDNLFDMSMMYTAITRAKNNLLFYTKDFDTRYQTLMKSSYINEINALYKFISDTHKCH